MERPSLDTLYLEHVAGLRRQTARVLADQGWDALAIHSGLLAKRSRFDDQFWAFRPCPHFQHWLPLAEWGCLLIVPGDEQVLPTLYRRAESSVWDRPSPPETQAFREAFDVVDSAAPGPSRDRLRRELQKGRVAFVGEDDTAAAEWGLSPEATCPPALLASLDALRTTKTPYEIACIAEANRRARPGHEALRDAFAAGGASELDLHLLYLRATSQDDAETPYKNIVALGQNAATLHHVSYGRDSQPRPVESLLVDAGATCRGYASDVTRTWVRGRGGLASAFGHLVAGVEAIQTRMCDALRIGVPYERLHDESHRQVAAVLRDLGVVRAPLDEAVASGLTRTFFPHGLGHSLGLQTHDVGCGLRAPRRDNPFLRNTSDVAAGQVLTIEPGIYFIDALLAPLREDARQRAMVDWGLVDALSPLGGVRIEDDVLVLERGIRNFTREELPIGGGVTD